MPLILFCRKLPLSLSGCPAAEKNLKNRIKDRNDQLKMRS